MASPIIFKNRIKSAFEKNAPKHNRQHMFYIAKRNGVALNYGMSHGLFGKMANGSFENISDISEMGSYIYKKTKEKTHIHRGIISLAESDAERLGYLKRGKWEEMIKKEMLEIADKLRIPPSRIEYVCAVHMERGHPHLHYMLWDTEQGIKKPYVHKKTANEIRVKLTKNIFQEEMQHLINLKNTAREVLTSESKDFYKSFFEPIESMTNKEYKKYKEELELNPELACEKLMYSRFTKKFIDGFAEDFFEFKERLPKSGRLSYQYLSPELKSDLDDLMLELIYSNDDMYREFKTYIKSSGELASYYSKSEDKIAEAEKNAEKDILKRMGNCFLDKVKEINKYEYQMKGEEYAEKQQDFKRSMTISIILDLFSLLSRESNARKNQAMLNKRELSKQAKIERAIEMEHTGIEWGDD